MAKVPESKNKSKQIISGYPLLIIPEVAIQIGLNESILIQQIHYWLLTAGKEINGKKWIYNSYAAWQKQFPFWSISTIRRTAKNLEKHNLIETDNFNHNSIDRTTWYTVNYAEFERLFKMNNGEVKMNNACVQNEPTIPETTQRLTTETTKKNNAEKEISAFGDTEIIDLENENASKDETLNSSNQEKKEKSSGKKEKKGRRPRKPVEPLHTPLKQVFLKKYEAATKLRYYWTPADGKNLNGLIAKIRKTFEDQGKEISQESITESFKLMLDNLPQWIKEKAYSMPTINSKYNETINQIKNGNKKQFGTSNKKESTIERARRLADADKNP